MTEKRNDNWGCNARIGMFIVANEAVPEAEWWAMAPPDVSIHAARITAPTPWARWDDAHQSVVLEEDVQRGIEQFAAMRLSAVVTGHSSSSVLGGEGWDDAIIKQLSGYLPENTAVTTNGRDCQAALRASRVSQPFLVFPPWFGEAFLVQGRNYFLANGFNPAGEMRIDPGADWRDVPPSELYPRGAGFEQDVDSLYHQVREAFPPDADSVLLVGTGMRCVAVIDALENELKRPVISANQASLWHCLQLARVQASINGYGSLFGHQAV